MPRELLATLSATSPDSLALEFAVPAGTVTAVPERFGWRAADELRDVTFVLLDATFGELCRASADAAGFEVDAQVRAALAHGEFFHWRIEAEGVGGRQISPPMALAISR